MPPARETASAGEGTEQNWELSYTLKNGDMLDLAYVPFTFTVHDIAGNTPISLPHEEIYVRNRIQYFEPITAITGIASDHLNRDFVRNGGIISVANESNHGVTATFAEICGRAATPSGENISTMRLEYQVPVNERAIPEGAVTFSYGLTDPAGNILSIDETNDEEYVQVTYDRTAPRVAVTPDNICFTNGTITYNCTYDDLYLYDMQLDATVNEAFGEEERYYSSSGRLVTERDGERVIIPITLEMDGNYTVTGAVEDRAGNTALPVSVTRVTVDTTNPEIRAVNIDFSAPAIFQSGFKISDYIEIEETNLKGVVCSVTDEQSSRDWDFDEPITGDGKKSIYLLAADMVDNMSGAVTFDIYIDGTTPRPIVRETVSGDGLYAAEKPSFISEMELAVGLESMHIEGISSPDQITEMYLETADGRILVNFLNELTPNEETGLYTYRPAEFGDYTLVVAAADGVGNETGELRYAFSFRDKSIWQKFTENKPLFVCTMTVLALGALGLLFLLIYIKRRKKREQEQAVIARMKLRQ